MHRLHMPTISKLDKTNFIQITLVSMVFLLFLANATGILEIGWISKPSVSINSNLIGHLNSEISYWQAFRSYEFYNFIITGICLSFLLPLLKPGLASLLTFFFMLPPFLINYFTIPKDPMIPMEYTLIMILILYVTNILSSYFIEVRSKQNLLAVFGLYIPPQLTDIISKQSETIDLSGESRYMTVFFSDLQNFTGISEQLNPKQLTALLNEYFTAMTEVLYEYEATIDKYMGDSIMAFWGAPLVQKDHARRAAETSLRMHELIKEISQQFQNRGWPAPKMSIGINSGNMNVGNMGSKYRVAYTVIGDAVNTASRIEHLTRTYKVPTIVTETTRNDSEKDIVYRELDRVQVRGKQNFTNIYEPVCKRADFNQLIEKKLNKHNIAINQYKEGNWFEAKKRFMELSKSTMMNTIQP